ncbi:MAG: DUF4115 domain-containing protein [Proteobacteria bacterium]|nr:DUF4115 domain-containing protein [Pseudomonadota bacterium]
MRLAHSADLATVASTLRIRLVYLQAIEEGRFSELPGPTYAAGFVRAYAEYLGLDLPEVMRRYREVALGSDRQAPLIAPSPVVEGTMPTGFILLVAAVLAALAYGAWYYLTLNGRDAGDIVAQLPKQIADIVGMEATAPDPSAQPPKAAAAPEPKTKAAEDTSDQSADQTAPAAVAKAETPEVSRKTPKPANAIPDPARPERTAAAAAKKAVDISPAQQASPAKVSVPPAMSRSETATAAATARKATTMAQETAAGPAPAETAGEGPPARPDSVLTTIIPAQAEPVIAAGVPDAAQTATLPGSAAEIVGPEPPSRVVLRATAISWVELRDANGKRVFSRLLKKGETYNVPGRNGITLATGNAGAVDVLVDGQTIGPLGPVGAVRRDVLLEPAALLQRINARQ